MKCAPRDGTAILLVVEGMTVAGWRFQADHEALGDAATISPAGISNFGRLRKRLAGVRKRQRLMAHSS